MSKLLIVIDIDATISDATARYSQAGPQPNLTDVDAYLSWVESVNNRMGYDDPVSGMKDFVRALIQGGSHIVYATNREEKHREITENWLYDHGFPIRDVAVLMREYHSYTSAIDYKGTVIKNLIDVHGFSDVIVIDDDPAMEVLCAKKGYTLLQAKSGGRL
jgi:predicted secreted acid phosphatase